MDTEAGMCGEAVGGVHDGGYRYPATIGSYLCIILQTRSRGC